MDKTEAQIRDADEASRILNSPVFIASFEDVRQAYLTALTLIPTTAEGDDQAKDVRRKLAVLEDIHSTFTRRITTGKIARSMLEKTAGAARGATKTLSNLIRSR